MNHAHILSKQFRTGCQHAGRRGPACARARDLDAWVTGLRCWRRVGAGCERRAEGGLKEGSETIGRDDNVGVWAARRFLRRHHHLHGRGHQLLRAGLVERGHVGIARHHHRLRLRQEHARISVHVYRYKDASARIVPVSTGQHTKAGKAHVPPAGLLSKHLGFPLPVHHRLVRVDCVPRAVHGGVRN